MALNRIDENSSYREETNPFREVATASFDAPRRAPPPPPRPPSGAAASPSSSLFSAAQRFLFSEGSASAEKQKRPSQITGPTNVQHRIHVRKDASSRTGFSGLPPEWAAALQKGGISPQEVNEHPVEVMDALTTVMVRCRTRSSVHAPVLIAGADLVHT